MDKDQVISIPHGFKAPILLWLGQLISKLMKKKETRMTGIYYTTSDIKSIFGWESDMTVHRRRASGFLPDPDLPGKPNKWLRTKIDAIVDPKNNSETDPNAKPNIESKTS